MTGESSSERLCGASPLQAGRIREERSSAEVFCSQETFLNASARSNPVLLCCEKEGDKVNQFLFL